MVITLRKKITILILYIILTERKKKRQRRKWILTYPSMEEQRKATYVCIHTILSVVG